MTPPPYGPRNWPREASIARRAAELRAAAGLPECPWPCCNPPAPDSSFQSQHPNGITEGEPA